LTGAFAAVAAALFVVVVFVSLAIKAVQHTNIKLVR
jgi:hypothetical protein